ncbi:hypothetical protein JX265_010732 [Neoarthrinium moseri]|uniref:Uncharacterized protein n=1 Tax=Neoarthrinium moseri TaxID=1658444 RepID=A0A9P9WDS6_9PEZI|nr:hypothetical protein JX265_010732 [Neoarthrinium moseri]
MGNSPTRGGHDDGARDSNVTSFTALIEHHRGRARSESPKKTHCKQPSVASSAERRARRRPTPLDLSDARKYGEIVRQRRGVQAIHFPITPAEALLRQVNQDGSSSVYSADAPPFDGAPTVSPLRVTKRINVLKSYNDWKETNTPQLMSPPDIRSARSKSVSQIGQQDNLMILPATTYQQPPPTPPTSEGKRGLIKSATVTDMRREPVTAHTDQFTPLTPWLMGGEGKRKASKTLFGTHGWLHDTKEKTASAEARVHKPSSFFDGIKKKAREFAEKADFKTARRLPGPSRVTISLDPREQSLLYCELEFILSNALDAYIKSQLNGGRLDPDKLKKVADGWASRGRPRVVGFRYDLETQLDLVALHTAQFRFYGARMISEPAVAGLLATLRNDARTMRVRTLCQPDSVVAKHIVDSQALLQLIGSAESLQISLAEVSQFFKVVLERENALSEREGAA